MNNNSPKTKQTILITGASSGIGKATALLFAKKGWNVAATMRDPLKEKELTGIPGIKLYPLDVTSPDSVNLAFERIITDYGKIDVLVNNAGFGADGVFEAMDDDFIRKQFETNVFGLMRMTREALKHMRPNKTGTIVQVASVGGRVAFPLFSIYHASKWAVEGFSESLQFEAEQFNIRIKIIEPGAIKTEFYGRSRAFVKPETTSEYDSFTAKVEKLNQSAGAKGADASVVADTIYKSVTDNSKKLRYPVAYPANILLPLKRFLPASWYYGFVRKNYGI
ncbi:MAG: SDR family oxidoreductase [Bacteroidales bacterium]|nr:SDR family oxidoreductase [Bacteroidales bacterium]